jgi:hypothetical protein
LHSSRPEASAECLEDLAKYLENFTDTLLNRLEFVASCRFVLRLLAQDIIEASEKDENPNPALANLFSVLMRNQFSENLNQQLQQSCLCFLAKILVKSRGMQTAAGMMLSPKNTQTLPLLAEIPVAPLFSRMAATKAPEIKPLLILDETDLFMNIGIGIQVSGFDQNSQLEKCLSAADKMQLKRFLCMALYEEVSLSSTCELTFLQVCLSNTLETKKQNWQPLMKLLRAEKNLPFLVARERAFMVHLADNTIECPTFTISANSSFSQMLLMGVVSHLCGTVMSLPSHFAPFGNLLFAPQTQAQMYLPTMPDDPRKRAASISLPFTMINFF